MQQAFHMLQCKKEHHGIQTDKSYWKVTWIYICIYLLYIHIVVLCFYTRDDNNWLDNCRSLPGFLQFSTQIGCQVCSRDWMNTWGIPDFLTCLLTLSKIKARQSSTDWEDWKLAVLSSSGRNIAHAFFRTPRRGDSINTQSCVISNFRNQHCSGTI